VRALRVTALITAGALCVALCTASEPARAEIDRSEPFVKSVNGAIWRGAAWLLTQQASNGAWTSGYDNSYPAATTALCYHTLRVCGVPRNDPQMENAYARLREQYSTAVRRSQLRTYTAAVVMMAVEDHARGDMIGSAVAGGREPENRKAAQADREWMEELVQFLRVNQRRDGVWHYGIVGLRRPRNRGGYDHSNTQYALLGLKAARRMGVHVEPLLFRRTLDHLIKAQEKRGPRVARFDGRSRQRSRDMHYDHARGWGYTDLPKPKGGGAYGSMTAGSLGALVICRSELIGTQGYPDHVDENAEQSIWHGLAWLGKNFSVKGNPEMGGWHYYYLYALERAGVLAGVDYVARHDWYGEGAKFLLGQQDRRGSWNEGGGRELATCFALLFLKRGTIPVRRGAVTPSVEENPDLFKDAAALRGKDFEDFVDLIVSRYARATSEQTKTSFVAGLIGLGEKIIPALLKRMGAGRPNVRRAAQEMLFGATGLALPFDPDAKPDERMDALLAFEVWYMENKLRIRKDPKTGLLAPQPD